MARQTYMLEKNVSIQSQKALKLLNDIQVRQSRAQDRQHATSMARLKNVRKLNQKFVEFHDKKESVFADNDHMDPT